MAINKINTRSIQDTTVSSADIADSAITNAKVSPSAAIAQSKVSGLSTSLTNLCTSISTTNTNVTALDNKIGSAANNIGLLGFKMAVNDGLTVFNLIDGVVDEFHDESGTDEAEGSNDLYNCSSDFYVNSDQPTGAPTCGPISAGFAIASVTEADTSTAGTNPEPSSGSPGSFAVAGMTSINAFLWGSGGGASQSGGGGGGFASGTVSVSQGQTLSVIVGEGGEKNNPSPEGDGGGSGGFGGNHPADSGEPAGNRRGGGPGYPSRGGGLTYLGTATIGSAPTALLVAGSGGGGGYNGSGGTGPGTALVGGAGGGGTGDAGAQTGEQTGANSDNGGGGDTEQGGSAGSGNRGSGQSGGLFYGGAGNGGAGGGAGYYGGGGGHMPNGTVPHGAGGGGSSYTGHPQVTSGATEEGSGTEGGGIPKTGYVSSTNEGGAAPPQSSPSGTDSSGGVGDGENGYLLITGCQAISAGTTSTTIVSNAFASNSVATSSRIVVFEENVGTPTLNTDIIASISRDGGSNFTNATLADSGYVTGSSGQRILTGQADISGQPSGQSMRWKLALANNIVKIHGVALQWS